MIVITLSLSPPKLCGYLTQWFTEIDTGVYVGHTSARVREKIWEKITETIGVGRASMIYSTNTEQGMAFKTWNTEWQPVDFEGVQLIRRPLPKKKDAEPYPEALPMYEGLSYYMRQRSTKESPSSKIDQKSLDKNRPTVDSKENPKKYLNPLCDYCVLDLETGGLDPELVPIIEMGCVRVRNRKVSEQFQCLIRVDKLLDENIIRLTGITDAMLKEEGLPLDEAMSKLLSFIGNDKIIGHNIQFDLSFLQKACATLGLEIYSPDFEDTWIMSKEAGLGLRNYRLVTLLKHFQIASDQEHRALQDAILTQKLFEKLNEIRNQAI